MHELNVVTCRCICVWYIRMRTDFLEGKYPSKRATMTISPQDYIEILNLVHRLLHTMDRGDEHGFAELFAQDGQLEVTLIGQKCHGHAELMQWSKNINKVCCSPSMLGACMLLTISVYPQRFQGCTHWEGNVVIEGAEKGVATNLSYWKVTHCSRYLTWTRSLRQESLNNVLSRDTTKV